MRQFSAVLEMPTTCSCCDAALPVGDLALSRGKYRVELPEGATPSECRLGNVARVILGGGKLVVMLRQSPLLSKGTWALLPHYNTDAFGRAKQSSIEEKHATAAGVEATHHWEVFEFTLREFFPNFATWCAELKFVEVDPVTYNAVHGKVPAHNAARFTLSLDTLA